LRLALGHPLFSHRPGGFGLTTGVFVASASVLLDFRAEGLVGLRGLVSDTQRGTELIPCGLEVAVPGGQLLLGGAELLARRFELLPQGIRLLARLVTFLARRCRFLSPGFNFRPKVAGLLPERIDFLSKIVTLLTNSFELLARRIELALTLLALGDGALSLGIELGLHPSALSGERLLELRPYRGGGLLCLGAQLHGFGGHAAFRLGPRGRDFGLETPSPLGSDVFELRGPALLGVGFSGAPGAVELFLVA
jgi:hypothetical protein